MDVKACELLGVKVGEHARPFPGLAPLAHKLSELSRVAADLEKDSYELKQVRATLLLNFAPGSPYNQQSFAVDESLSTPEMLVAVLSALTGHLKDYQHVKVGEKEAEKKDG